ncbi:unnamed protein product [Blepharisma stoltei]|uniref:Uncharacterized protein n=1 Tax=Blepharisma stoltei TaxID=1481888 RepID=A0AAU9KFY9_9CILI|nr:unnamed protein product [Blepharisma stoltei]
MADLAFIQKEIELRQNLAGENFISPPYNGAKVFVMGELLSAKDFEDDNLYIFMDSRLPPNWQYNLEDYYDPRATETDVSDLINRGKSVTHCSRAVPSGKNRKPISHFCFPVAWNLIATDDALFRAWPQVCVQVNSVDDYGRHHILGYGFFEIPNTPGFHKISLQTWRPIESLRSEIYSFYLGGSVRIENPWELSNTFSFDEEGEKSVVNRYGLSTQSGGSVQFQLSVAIQTQTELEKQREAAKILIHKQQSELVWRRNEKKAKVVVDRTTAQYKIGDY